LVFTNRSRGQILTNLPDRVDLRGTIKRSDVNVPKARQAITPKETRATWLETSTASRTLSIRTRPQRPHIPRPAIDDNKRMNLRISAATKAKLVRAAALRDTDLTNFVTQTALREAEAVIEAAEVIRLSGRDHARLPELLENPPSPNAKLRADIAALPADL